MSGGFPQHMVYFGYFLIRKVKGLPCGHIVSKKDDYCGNNELLCHTSFPHGATATSGRGPSHNRGFTITLRHTTFRRTPLDE
jgi:hypothetical protein